MNKTTHLNFAFQWLVKYSVDLIFFSIKCNTTQKALEKKNIVWFQRHWKVLLNFFHFSIYLKKKKNTHKSKLHHNIPFMSA